MKKNSINWSYHNSKNVHRHPFDVFVNNNTKYFILGTFPGKEFTNPREKIKDDDWYYSTHRNTFWDLVLYALNSKYKKEALNIIRKKELLKNNNFGIGDIIVEANRIRNNNSDKNLFVRKILDLLNLIHVRSSIQTIFLTSKSMYQEFFLPAYVNNNNTFNLFKKEKLLIQGTKIEILHFNYFKRIIKIIPLNSPAREIPRFEIKKEIYKELFQNELR